MKTRPDLRHRFARNIIATSLMAATIPAFAGVVISQVYGGGGNSGATLKNDFIELFNAGTTAVSLAGWSVQYASAAGTSWTNKTDLPNVVLLPGQYFLVQEAQGAGGTVALPTPDATGTLLLSATNGKVALVSSTTPLTGANPIGGATVVDLLGFGSANGYEGAASAVLSNTTAALRAGNGCADTNNNSSDFSTGAPNPRNTSSAFNVCAAVVNQPIITSCPAGTMATGEAGSVALTASDADSRVNAASLAVGTPAGFTLGTLTAAAADGDAASVALNIAGSVTAGNYAVVVNFGNDEAQTASCTVNVAVSGTTSISAIQGSGPSSPLVGQSVTTQGVVTKVTNNGFFMQSETPDSDDATSEGIYVYTGSTPTVLAGNRVRVAATVTEYAVGSGAGAVANPLTELTSPAVTVLAAGIAIAPTTITLPEVNEGDLERYEGMLVHINNVLTVSQNYFLGRYGQLTVSADGRLEKPTNRHPAGSTEALAMADDNARRRILLDDGSSLQNPNPTPYLAADNTVRAGDSIAGITGVIDYGLATSTASGLSDYRIQPTQPLEIVRTNPRTAAPDAVGGNIKVASFNVLNYFTTFTDGQTAGGQSGQGCTLGGATAAANCRGANNTVEFNRQKAKIVNAIKALNADVVGLMEIQNNGNTAVVDLLAGLNAATAPGTYASVALPSGGTGTDAIRVALIYKPGKVSTVGSAVSDTNPIHNRPPLVQTFAAANGEKFSVVVNHFKSKGSCPTSGTDADQGDGQGCWNALRTEQAQALRSYISGLQLSSGDTDVIVIGDLNAYGKEAPILDFTANGYVDQVDRFDNLGCSYVFDGEAGYLDHALATPSLSAQITGAKHWRINADEPAIIDYNTEFKQPACVTCGPDYYTNTAYRSSDHDPVVIGLNLVKQINGTAGRDTLTGTAGDDVITGGIGADTLTGGAGADQFVFTSLRDGIDTITDFQPGSDRIVLTLLLQSVGINSANPIANGYVTCRASGTDALIGIDPDAAGSAASRGLVLLKNQTCGISIPGNFVF
ncbi:MAG: ExeM/NucH family extracellular endonuclease [Azonexus sp.]|nr:ExeM/NucH family extracellular endonuclease [Azonexus sp.]